MIIDFSIESTNEAVNLDIGTAKKKLRDCDRAIGILFTYRVENKTTRQNK